MTLAIGVQYPYGRLRQALASLPRVRFPEAVILMSDSRWTFLEPPNKYVDEGTKVFTLDNSTAITYAGDSRAAEHCVHELKTKLKKLKNGDINYINIKDTFQRVFRYHKNRDKKTCKLLFLMGKYLRSGEVKLVYFESPKFEHLFVTGIKGIGDELAFNKVFNAIGSQIDDLSKYTGNVEKDTSTIAMLLANAFNEKAIRNENYETVGGLIQYVVVGGMGVHPEELSYTTDPTGTTDTWHRVTARNGEITTLQNKYNLSPNFIDVKHFGLHSYCD